MGVQQLHICYHVGHTILHLAPLTGHLFQRVMDKYVIDVLNVKVPQSMGKRATIAHLGNLSLKMHQRNQSTGMMFLEGRGP